MFGVRNYGFVSFEFVLLHFLRCTSLEYVIDFIIFSDRGSVMKISRPPGMSHPCLHSEMEVYPVSVQ